MVAHAIIRDNQLYLSAIIGKTDGSSMIRTEINGNPEEAHTLGLKAARELLNHGADPIIHELKRKC